MSGKEAPCGAVAPNRTALPAGGGIDARALRAATVVMAATAPRLWRKLLRDSEGAVIRPPFFRSFSGAQLGSPPLGRHLEPVRLSKREGDDGEGRIGAAPRREERASRQVKVGKTVDGPVSVGDALPRIVRHTRRAHLVAHERHQVRLVEVPHLDAAAPGPRELQTEQGEALS